MDGGEPDQIKVGRPLGGAVKSLDSQFGKSRVISLLAYLDPGTGSLLLQALVGGFAGFWVFLRYVWRRWTSKRQVGDPTKTTSDNESADSRNP